MGPKYQIFVSSTYEDLKNERDKVMKAVLEMGHIPVGMELFSAADEDQWKIITRQINDSDYYVVIAAHRYGSVTEGISYTEKEYNYAIETGVPTLGFIIADGAVWNPAWIDTGEEAKLKLTSFKSKLKEKLVAFWHNSDELQSQVLLALTKAITANPRPGWIRTTESAGIGVTNELSRLSGENAELRSRLETYNEKSSDLARYSEILTILEANIISPSYYYEDAKRWSKAYTKTLSNFFNTMAPQLQVSMTNLEISSYYGRMTNPQRPRKVRTRYPVPSNNINKWLGDLQALELVEHAGASVPDGLVVKDADVKWKLTQVGRSAYALLRRRKLLAAVKPVADVAQLD